VLPSPPDVARLFLAAVLTLAAVLGCAHRARSAAPLPAPSPALAAAPPGASPTPAAAPPARARKVEYTPVTAREVADAPNPHDHGGKPLCQRCHVNGEEELQLDPIALCAQCHDAAPMKHPFRVAQAGGARGLPLMAGDVVVCHTCHDPHDLKAHRAGLRLEYRDLCLRCHVRHGASGAAPTAPAEHPAK
jgi:predicted CXXCH cytochrome family protein